MHSPEQACNITLNIIAFFNKRDEGRNAAFIVAQVYELVECYLLEGVNLIQEIHEAGCDLITVNSKLMSGIKTQIRVIDYPLSRSSTTDSLYLNIPLNPG
jgi:hypothetical protein